MTEFSRMVSKGHSRDAQDAKEVFRECEVSDRIRRRRALRHEGEGALGEEARIAALIKKVAA